MRRNNLLLILAIELILGVFVLAGVAIFKNRSWTFWPLTKQTTAVKSVPSTPSKTATPTEILNVNQEKLEFLSLDGFSLDDPSVNPQIVAYKLPLKISDIYNWKQFNQKIKISKAQSGEVLQYGFAQMSYLNSPSSPQPNDFADYYAWVVKRGLPPFITSDSIIFYYNGFLAKARQALGEKVVYERLWEMTQSLYLQSLKQYSELESDTKEAARRNSAYFYVALQLLSDDQHILPAPPDYIADDVKAETANFLSRQEVNSRVFIYKLDYSNFSVATSSPKIQKFENAMLYLGWPVFLEEGSKNFTAGRSDCSDKEGPIISEFDAKIQNLQAWLIVATLGKSETDLGNWEKVYSFNNFFGEARSEISPLHYLTILKEIYGNEIKPEAFEQDYARITQQYSRLSYENSPRAGIGGCQGYDLKAKNEKGMRLLGYFQPWENSLFARLVWPVGGALSLQGSGLKPKTAMPDGTGQFVRGIPSMYDLSAVLGSVGSYTILKESGNGNYQGFDTAVAKVALDVQQKDHKEYFRDLSQLNLYSAMSLLGVKGNGYPSYMINDLWNQKQLQTFLFSWIQMRSSPYLFEFKESSIPTTSAKISTPTIGFEAQPDLYNRLSLGASAINATLKQSFSESDLTKYGLNLEFDEMTSILQKMASLSRDQLGGKKLNNEEISFLANVVMRLDYLVKSGTANKNLVLPLSGKTQTLAKVPWSMKLEVGKIKPIIVVFSHPDGYLLMGLGGALTANETLISK